MNRTFSLVFMLFFTILLHAQEWHTDLAKAKIEAASENKTILLVFQGSDWCAPCIKLDREVWSTELFRNFAKDHYVMLQADFPRKKNNAVSELLQKKNKALAETYNKTGIFPFVVLLNAKGIVLGETGYLKTDAKGYIQHLEALIH